MGGRGSLKIWFGLMKLGLFLVVGLMLLYGCATPVPFTPASSISSPARLDEAAISLTSRELRDTYRDGEAEANKRYKEKTIEVTGQVVMVRRTLSGCDVVLGEGVFLVNWDVWCVFSDTVDLGLSGLKKGDNVRIKGRCADYAILVILSECHLTD